MEQALYFSERYGDKLMALAEDTMTQMAPVPDAVFTTQQWLTRGSLKQRYGRETAVTSIA